MAELERTETRIRGFASSELDFQLMRQLGAANYQGGAPGEILHARGAIAGDDPYAWPPSFAALADRVRAAGTAAAAKGRTVTARDSFLRASMYYRSAEYFADPFGAAAHGWGMASRDAFLAASAHMAERIEPVQIPFEGKTLPGYFMTPPGGARGGRTAIVLGGFDATGEELYFAAARGGLERGYNVLVGEGPGQVGCLRLHPDLIFRPDFEVPIAAMVDHVLARPEVSAERLALYGISFGGYFALRAGAHDRRVRALVLNSPIVDLHAYMVSFIGSGLASNPPPVKLEEVDAIPDAEFSRAMKLSFKGACRRFGVTTFDGWMRRLKDFVAVGSLAAVRCPSLAMAGAGEGAEPAAQFAQFCKGAGGPVTQRMFTAAEGADMHCQVGNVALSAAVVFDWLDDVFGA